ncbi:MAG TPA: hypothetical protein VFQ86_02315 [Arachidicoccus soli]|nr:hypothetical protein [Arachidicoccus soli]
MKRYIYFASVIVFLSCLVFTFDSCRKKADTIAKITVKDTANMVVPGARVILYGTSTTDPIQPVIRRDTQMTNSNGVAVFNYNDVYQLGQAGVAVLNISAKKESMNGSGMIKITEEKENDATVLIQP